MDAGSRQTGVSTEAADCLVRIQQMLLAAKYFYLDADEQSWPLCQVQMGKGHSRILVAPWPGADTEVLIRTWDGFRRGYRVSAGLLLVGSAPTGDPQVQQLFARAGGTVAYLDAQRGQFRLQRRWRLDANPPKPLLKGHLKRFLRPQAGAPAGEIDCLAKIPDHLERTRQARAFDTEVRSASGVLTPWLTYGLLASFIVSFAAMVFSSGACAFRPWAG